MSLTNTTRFWRAHEAYYEPPDEPEAATCPDCEGDGHIDGEDCRKCEGFGEVPEDSLDLEAERGEYLFQQLKDRFAEENL